MAKTVDRRSFLAGAAIGAASAAATQAAAAGDPAILERQPWRDVHGPGVDAAPYGQPSPHEADAIRRRVPWLTAEETSSINFTPIHALEGVITPNGVCFERHHSGAAQIDPARHRLMVHGMVERELVFTVDELKRFPKVGRAHFLECAANTGMEWRGPQMNRVQFTHGMVHNVMYTGVRLSDVLREAGVRPGAAWLLAEGADAALMSRSIPLEKALDDCLIAFAMNGEALRPEQGYPLRLVVPGWEGVTWIKWLRRLELGDKPWHQREVSSRYTDLWGDGVARRFTWVMDAKSVITSPSPERPIRHGRGRLSISGLAWSGRGTVREVHVSIDGGRNWAQARLDAALGPKSLHRFYFDMDWDGRLMLLQSRAVDSAGFVQPTRAELRRVRGESSVYHNNGIQTWSVNAAGEVENVEVG